MSKKKNLTGFQTEAGRENYTGDELPQTGKRDLVEKLAAEEMKEAGISQEDLRHFVSNNIGIHYGDLADLPSVTAAGDENLGPHAFLKPWVFYWLVAVHVYHEYTVFEKRPGSLDPGKEVLFPVSRKSGTCNQIEQLLALLDLSSVCERLYNRIFEILSNPFINGISKAQSDSIACLADAYCRYADSSALEKLGAALLKNEEKYFFTGMDGRAQIRQALESSSLPHASDIIQQIDERPSLYHDFLSGREYHAADWKTRFLENPENRKTIEGLVWEQDGQTFTLLIQAAACGILSDPESQNEQDNHASMTGFVLCDADSALYTPGDAPLRLAHPMDLSQAQTAAWKTFLAKFSIRQPFLQINEPVIDPSMIREDRYDRCQIHTHFLEHRREDGISFQMTSGYSSPDQWRSSTLSRDGCTPLLSMKDCIHEDFIRNHSLCKSWAYEGDNIAEYSDECDIVPRLSHLDDAGRKELHQLIYFPDKNSMLREILGDKASDYPEILDDTADPELFDLASYEDTLVIHSIRLRKFSRQSNHIIVYLDRLTLRERICKNNPDICSHGQLDGLGRDTIDTLIDTARENHAYASLSELLGYKADHFQS